MHAIENDEEFTLRLEFYNKLHNYWKKKSEKGEVLTRYYLYKMMKESEDRKDTIIRAVEG
jgi:uncharacterized protein YktA (UPF0223 family)